MRVDKGQLAAIIGAENTALEAALASCEQQVAALSRAVDNPLLAGEAYRKMRDRMVRLRIPLAKAQGVAFNAVLAGNARNLAAAQALPETSPGVADTDEAQQKIGELGRINGRLKQQAYDAEAAGLSSAEVQDAYWSLYHANQRTIDALGETIEAIQGYASASSGYYEQARSAAATLDAAGRSVASHLAGNGFGNLSWASAARASWPSMVAESRLGITEQKFVRMYKDEFEFEEEHAELFWEVYERLYDKYPGAEQSRIDWMWLRLMGGFVYEGIAWDLTAGQVIEYAKTSGVNESDPGAYHVADEKEFLTEVLGLSEEDYEALITSIPNQSYYAERNRQTDFAHQCIAAATEYDVRIGSGSPIDALFSGGVAERAQYAGWMGDCVLRGERGTRPTLGYDDFNADLDALNISHAALDGDISYQATALDYYASLREGAFTRAERFLENNGGYDSVVEQVFANLTSESDLAAVPKMPVALTDPDVREVTVIPTPFPDAPQAIHYEYFPHTTEEMVEIIGRHEELSDTSRFIEALRGRLNELPMSEGGQR